MIILHAGIRDGYFLLWGETPVESEAVPAKRRGRKMATARRVSPLPYMAGAEALSAALTGAVSILPVDQASAETVIVWMPTVDGRPLASSHLIAESPEASGQVQLAPWKVTALALPTAQMIDLLCSCVGKETLAQGLIVGASLAFWAQAVRFAAQIVARQSFLPGIELKGSSAHAQW